MKVTLINPNLVYQKDDPFTTGVVYMPIGLASFAATLRLKGHSVEVIDSFGSAPNRFRSEGALVYRGLNPQETANRVSEDFGVCFIYAINVTYHRSVLEILSAVRERFSDLPIAILENTQAVTAYSLRAIQNHFYSLGADYVVLGEPEWRGVQLVNSLEAKLSRQKISEIDGIGMKLGQEIVFSLPSSKISDLDALPPPAWDLFPVKNYWKIGYAHGPLTRRRYLPILSSRGCPYPCRFCIIPETNDTKWRARSASNVVDEMERFQRDFGVSEFHFEDLDPTISDARVHALCDEITNRRLKFNWKLCAGTKVETIKSSETIDKMASAGCTYISISPESGSEDLMRKMRKPFDRTHALKVVRQMKKRGIRSQACFVLGFPGETDGDRLKTEQLVEDLVRAGLDEIAQFIITPIPGSDIFDQYEGYKDFSELTFSPRWRKDYVPLNAFRLSLYRKFLFWKLRYQPLYMFKQPINFLTRRFETKMEMTPYRALQSVIRSRVSA